jgi:hypothetical protein
LLFAAEQLVRHQRDALGREYALRECTEHGRVSLFAGEVLRRAASTFGQSRGAFVVAIPSALAHRLRHAGTAVPAFQQAPSRAGEDTTRAGTAFGSQIARRFVARSKMPASMSRARLLKRVFDIERCPQGGGSLKIIAAIEEPAVIERILTGDILQKTAGLS